MKFLPLLLLVFVLLGCLWPASGFSAVPAATAADNKYKVDTTWPGVSFTIAIVNRLDANNILLLIKVSSSAAAPPATFIGSWPDGKNYVMGGKGQKMSAKPTPYSMMPAVIMDKTTKVVYKPIPLRLEPGKPFYGFSEIIDAMHPSEWFQMALQVPLPVPPPNPDGTVPIQKVDVTIPKAKGSIKDVIVPPLK